MEICSADPHANFPQLTARLLRANAYLSAGRKAGAADDLAHACRLVSRDSPRDVQSVLFTLDGLVEAYADAGQYADAVKWVEKSVELAPNEAAKQTYLSRLKDYKAKLTDSQPKRSSP